MGGVQGQAEMFPLWVLSPSRYRLSPHNPQKQEVGEQTRCGQKQHTRSHTRSRDQVHTAMLQLSSHLALERT